MKTKSILIFISFVLGLSFLGCSLRGKTPIDALYYEKQPDLQPNLIIFIRGMGGTMGCLIQGHKCFDREGFVESVVQKGLTFDMIAPNAHFGYYNSRNLEIRQ